MTASALERVRHLCTISTKAVDFTPVAETGNGTHAHTYGAMLQAYFAGDTASSLGLATEMLADDPESADRFRAYRLWIEILAEASETAALVLLLDHVRHRADADEPEHYATYAALRGLIHFELDEMEAVQLLTRSLTRFSGDPYVLELRELFAGRKADNGDTAGLLTATGPLRDFCHWQTLCRRLLAQGEEQALEVALNFLAHTAKHSPLPLLFEFHRCLERGFHAAAALVAARLVEQRPRDPNFQYNLAFALFEDGNYPRAKQVLSELVRAVGETDPEIVGLLGHCYAKLGDATSAAPYLRRAREILTKSGLPSSHLAMELANVEEEIRGDFDSTAIDLPRPMRKWLLLLSPRRAHEFLSASEPVIDRLLRPMGAEPRQGDLCFFATASDRQGSQDEQWKIVGIYAVDSDAIWHPTQRHHSVLRLVARLPVGIPVEVAVRDEREAPARQQSLAIDAPIRFGVYELDSAAIDLIEDAVRLSREEIIERRRGSGQSRRPTA